jgi:hypothetical protein
MCLSAPTARNVLTRAYLDLYAFYVPFRLLWDQWVEFITLAGNDAALPTVPTVTDLFERAFEFRNDGVELVPWNRRAYNKVYNSHFAVSENSSSVGLDDTNIHIALQRPSTLEVGRAVTNIPSEDISTAANVDDLREAFAKDQFQKLRNYYGDRYVDYLGAVGVKVPWTIQDDPETIGKQHRDWRYRQVNGTQDQSLGEAAGMFESSSTMNIKRTFIPEHGMLCFLQVCRADPMMTLSPQGVQTSKVSRDQYWSPEFQMNKDTTFPQWVLGNAQVLARRQPYFEDYRKGVNESFIPSPAPLANTVAGMVVDEPKDRYGPSDFNIFDDQYFAGGYNYQSNAEFRLVRHSPLIRS